MTDRFDFHLQRILDCPANECVKGSSCSAVVDPKWATLLGWGNPRSPILFVGLNPHYSPEARASHTVSSGLDPLFHVRALSREGFARVRHFSYHSRIMRAVKAGLSNEDAEDIPDVLEDFAFFSEVALCPTENGKNLPDDVIDRCLKQNLLPFIEEFEFRFIITLGKTATQHTVRALISPGEANRMDESPFSRCHGKAFTAANRHVVASYHPNARGVWDRDAVASTLLRLSRTFGIALS